jgi:predicted nucleic acid-binding protein
MTPPSRINAVLDACVLYPAPIRDLLLSFAEVGLFKPFWSDKINNEWVRNLLKNRTDLRLDKLQLTVSAMNSAFPDANIKEDCALIELLALPDSDDRHVLAAAIHSNSRIIVTANLKDFPKPLLSFYSIRAQTPDDFIASLIKQNELLAFLAFENLVKRLKNPPLNNLQVLETLHKLGLRITRLLLLEINK